VRVCPWEEWTLTAHSSYYCSLHLSLFTTTVYYRSFTEGPGSAYKVWYGRS